MPITGLKKLSGNSTDGAVFVAVGKSQIARWVLGSWFCCKYDDVCKKG